jgi:hypothetical protein
MKLQTVLFSILELAVDKAGLKARFHLKQYVPRKPKKWSTMGWGFTDSREGYLLNYQNYQGKKRNQRQRSTVVGTSKVKESKPVPLFAMQALRGRGRQAPIHS